MRELEPVNMLAIEEYDRVKKRYEFLQERKGDFEPGARGHHRQAEQV